MGTERETRYPNRLLYGFVALTALLFAAMTYLAFMADASLVKFPPSQATANFNMYTSLLNLINTAGFVVLLLYSNIYFYRKRYGGLLFIVTFILSTVFINLYYAYLSEVFFRFKKAQGLWKGDFSLAPFIGLILTSFILAVVIANYFMIRKVLKDKDKPAQP